MTLGHVGPQDRLAMYGKGLLGPHIWGVCGVFPHCAEPPGFRHLCSSGGHSDRNSLEQRGQNAAQRRNTEPVGIMEMEVG